MKTTPCQRPAFVCILIAALGLLCVQRAQAVAFVATNTVALVTNTWSSSATWSPNGVPGQADTAEIGSGAIVVVDVDEACAGLIIDSGGKLENVTTSGQTTLSLYGNLVNSNSGSAGFNKGGSSGTKLTFASGNAAWIGSGDISAGKFQVVVNSGVTLDISGATGGIKMPSSGTLAFTVNGTLVAGTSVVNGNANKTLMFVLGAAGTLVTANVNGITNGVGTLGTITNFVNTGSTNGITLPTTANYFFNGISAQVTAGLPSAVNNLIISNASGVALSSPCTVNGSLSLSDGVLKTTANNLVTIGSGGSISGASPSAFVNGPLAQVYSSTGTQTFPIGTNGNYRAVSVNLTTVSGTPTITVTPHEPSTLGASANGVALFTNRDWTVASSVSSGNICTLTVDGTGFTPVNTGVLIDANGTTTNSFSASFASPNYTSSGISLTASSDLALGDCAPPTSAPTNIVVTTPGCSPVSVKWNSVSGAASYNVYRKLSGGAYGTAIGSSVTTNYSDPTAINGSNYVYAVTAASACGAESAKSADSGSVIPSSAAYIIAAPSGVSTGIGFTAAFSVTVINTTSNQWIVSTNAGSTWNKVSSGTGGTTTNYTTGTTATNMNGYQYACVAYGCSGAVTSAPATLTIQPYTQYDFVRLVWLTNLFSSASSPSSVSNTAYSAWTTMNTNAARTNLNYLWSDLPLGSHDNTGSGNIASTFQRMRNMALAYALPTCGYYTNAALATEIVKGLDWMTTNYYTTNTTLYANWYDWEIASPKAFVYTLTYLYPALTAAQITSYIQAMYNFGPDSANEKDYFWWGALTGANTTDNVLIMALQGALLATNSATVTRYWQNTTGHPVNPQTNYVITNGSALLWEAQGNLSGKNPQDFSGSSVFVTVTSGDGFYADGSFIFHGATPYTGQYGNTMLGNIADLVHLLNGSTWQITDTNLSNIFVWVTNAFEPLIYNGALMDMVRGRAISWSKTTEYTEGTTALTNIAKVATFAPPALATSLNNFVNSPQVPPGQYHFAGMDRVVALRNGFGFGLSMDSTRVATYDINTTSPSDLKGWYTGDGMTYLYLGNPDTQFTGDMWATVDWYHLPGTTAETNATPSYSTTDQSWAGGAQVARTYGVAGLTQHSPGTTLYSKKSWFMFDNEIVCLGAGITCSDNGNQVDTTVENRRLGVSPTNNFWINGVSIPPNIGWSSNLTSATWCALDGVGGYYFPGGATNLVASFEADSGYWTDINPSDSSTGLFTDNFLKLYFKHGVKPANKNYAYVLMPNFTAAAMSSYATAPDIVVLTNTSAVQAASKPALGVVAANFFNAGTNSADLITVDNQASVITWQTNGVLSVGVADPTHNNAGNLTVTLARAATSAFSADAGVAVIQLSPQIILSVNVNGSLGKTYQASFALSSSSTNASVPVITSAALTGGVSGPFQLQFTGSSNATYSVLGTTNLLQPLTNWPVLGTATQIVSGVFRFSDAGTTNGGQRFYRLRSP